MSSAATLRELEAVFALRIADNRQFRSWLLSRTKFAKLWPLARLLDDQAGLVADTELTAAGVLLRFEVEQTRIRFAVHVASAIDAVDLEKADAQRQHAVERMSLDERLPKLMDFETVLLAPQALILDDPITLRFDRRVPFETVAGFVPQFGETRRIAA